MALAPALLGLWLGGCLRRRIAEERFRRVFYVALVVLGAVIVWRAAG